MKISWYFSSLSVRDLVEGIRWYTLYTFWITPYTFRSYSIYSLRYTFCIQLMAAEKSPLGFFLRLQHCSSLSISYIKINVFWYIKVFKLLFWAYFMFFSSYYLWKFFFFKIKSIIVLFMDLLFVIINKNSEIIFSVSLSVWREMF